MLLEKKSPAVFLSVSNLLFGFLLAASMPLAQAAPPVPGIDWLKTQLEQDRFYFRAGATYFDPRLDTEPVELSQLSEIADLAINAGPIEGSDVSGEPIPLLTSIVGYHLPWRNGNWSLELLLGLPITVELKAEGALADVPLVTNVVGTLPTGVPALGDELGETKALPVVTTMVYRFRKNKSLRPYLGAGPIYFFPFDSEITNEVLTEVADPVLEIDDKLGLVFQGGIDYKLHKNWWLALDIKYILIPGVEAVLDEIYLKVPGLPQFDYVRVGDANISTDINPLVIHLGIGFDF